MLKQWTQSICCQDWDIYPYFGSDRYMIDHHNGDVYLWDRESNIKLLALQAGTTPLSVDTAKLLTQTVAKTCWLTLQNRSQSCSSSRSSQASSQASARTHLCNSCYGTPQDPFWTNEDLTFKATLHNISINPASMDGQADGEIFESNHLGEIADIWSKMIWNLVKVGETYHHLCAQLLNPTSEELTNFVANCNFDSHLHHILHLDDLLVRDARHHIKLGYPVINYPRYIPITVELCRSSFMDFIDKLKADLTYFKDDFWNEEITKQPGSGQGTSTPNLLDASTGGPHSTTPRDPPPQATPVLLLRNTPFHHSGTPPSHHLGTPLFQHLEVHQYLHHNQYQYLGRLHHQGVNLNLSPHHHHSLSLLECQNLMRSKFSEQICKSAPKQYKNMAPTNGVKS